MSIDSELIISQRQIPSTKDVVRKIATFGFDVSFPDDFEFCVKDAGLWRTAYLDGEKSGFDYCLSEISSERELSDMLPTNIGDSIMFFGARGQTSVKLVAHVQRAICELSGAYGFVDGEVIEPQEMISGSKDIGENWDSIAERAKSDFDSAIAGHDFPLSPQDQHSGFQKWLNNGGIYTIIGWIAALLILAYLIMS